MGELRENIGPILERHAGVGGVTEVRIIWRTPGGDRSTFSGYYTPAHLDALVAHISARPGGPVSRLPPSTHPSNGEANIYFSLQAVNPAVTGANLGRLHRVGATTKDADILVYTLFVVDVDPVRPANVSATDAEKAEALKVTKAVRAWFQERDIPSILADSGNGYHLLVPLIPYRGEDVRKAAGCAHELLKLLHARFSTEGAQVDVSTFNPSRILKLYGTVAVKGEPTAERPHRLSSIDLTEFPADVDLFGRLAPDLEAERARRNPPAAPRSVASSAASTLGPGTPRRRLLSDDAPWVDWRRAALQVLPLESVYGDLLTGRRTGSGGWLECRDPRSPSGDRSPSAGVADGSGEAERAAFHSFRTGDTWSVFDYLIEVDGRAKDFESARDLVARLSGVPLPFTSSRASPAPPSPSDPPSRASKQSPEELIATFTSAWSGAADDEARFLVLREMLDIAVGLTPITREKLLGEVRNVTGVSANVIRDELREAHKRLQRRQKAKMRLPPPRPALDGSDRVFVDYVVNRDTVASFFDGILRALPPDRFLRFEHQPVFIAPGQGLVRIDEKNLAGLLNAFFEIRYFRAETEEDGEDREVFIDSDVLGREHVRTFVHDTRVISQLPQLNQYCRSPLFDTSWRFIGEPGFHPEAAVYYDGPEIEARHSGTELLGRTLEGVHWREDADRVNFLGMLLTAFTLPQWGSHRPFMTINGNKSGVGKTTLAKLFGIVVDGIPPVLIGYTPDEDELEKRIATRVKRGDRVIIIDNARVTGMVENQVIERCTSDSRPTFRHLGTNDDITRPTNDLLFCLTSNLTQLGGDLRRRVLPIHLKIEKNVHTLTWAHEDLEAFALAHRSLIVAELAAMVQRWLDAGSPVPADAARHSTGQRWAKTIDAILRANGISGFLTNFERSTRDFDPNWEEMQDIAATFAGWPPAPAAEWVSRLEEHGFGARFKDSRGLERSARAKATLVGILFAEYIEVEFPVPADTATRVRLERDYPQGEDHKPEYRFVFMQRLEPVPPGETSEVGSIAPGSEDADLLAGTGADRGGPDCAVETAGAPLPGVGVCRDSGSDAS